MKKIFIIFILFSTLAVALAAGPAATRPTTQLTTQPTTQPIETIPIQPDSILGRMLQGSNIAAPISPQPTPPPPDATSGMGAVKQPAPHILLRPEGYYILNRVARLGKLKDGFRELIFDADGKGMRDPPMRILPDQLLGTMEQQATGSSDPMAFRISGYITQYKDRNYILIDKAVPQPQQGSH